MILHKKFQKLGMIFWKNAQALNKATQGGFFFQKQLKPMGYYSGEKSKLLQVLWINNEKVCLKISKMSVDI